jgi:hypothetical protein
MVLWRIWRWIGPAWIVMIASGCQPAAKVENASLESHIKESFPNATIVSMKGELKHLTKVHEAKLKEGDKDLEVTLAEDGTILKVETKLSMSEVPKPVADAITAAAKGSPIQEVEKVERRGTIKCGKPVKLETPETYYEAEYKKLGLKHEIKLAPDGSRWTKHGSKPKA